MAGSCRARKLCSGLLVLAGLLCFPTARADEQVLLEEELEAGKLQIELFAAEVKVFLEAGATGYVRITAPADSAPIRFPIDWQTQGEEHVLRRLPAPEVEGIAPPSPQDLTVDLILPPETGIQLSGHDLRLTIERVDPEPIDPSESPTEAELEFGEDTASPANPRFAGQSPSPEPLEHAIQIEVDRASVDLWSLDDLVLTARQSEIRLEGLRGTAHLDLQDSNGEIRSHRGDLQLTGQGSDLDLVAGEGGVQVQWSSGDLTLQEGRGPLGGQIRDALVRIERRFGPVNLRGSSSTLSCRESLAPTGVFNLQGEDLVVVLEDWNGRVAARLVRGSLRGGTWRGKGDLSLTGNAGLDLQDLRGEFALRIQGDSDGRITGVQGQLKAVVQQASLQIDGAQRLELSATESRVTVSGVERVRKLSASDSELDLDFSATRDRRPRLELLGENEVDVLLASPCIVELMSGSAVDDSGIDISGCELMRRGTGRRRNPPLRIDGQPMTHLVVSASSETSLRVEGR